MEHQYMSLRLGAALAAIILIVFLSIPSYTQGNSTAGVYTPAQSSSISKQIPEVEVEALLEFKAHYIRKDSQYMLFSWNSSSTSIVCDSWVGISCTNMASAAAGTHQYHVHGIDLAKFRLAGSLAPHLGNLSFLSTLNFSENSLTGSIPWQLQGCTSLTLLNLNDNMLTGGIPSELGFLSHLASLDLGNNKLRGAIPPNLAMCTNLTQLILDYNQLTGPIPAELGQLGHLRELSLKQNMLSGMLPQTLSYCIRLEELHVSANQLSGHIFQLDFSNLTELKVLDLGSNDLIGEIPWQSLTNCTSLQSLDLSNNHLNGGIPSTLGKLSGLKVLHLQDNFLQGRMADNADYKALSLTEVVLSSNLLNGSLPSSLGDALTATTVLLDFSHNQLSGSLPVWFSQLVQAQTINLTHNNFAGTIPEDLGGLVRVRTLDLSSNNFVGGIPESLYNCAQLKTLDLSDNHLSGNLDLQFVSPIDLHSLDLSHNNLSGELPSYLEADLHSDLRLLNVSFNNLTGPIPTNGVFVHLDASSFQGNPGLCGPILRKECTGLQLSSGGWPPSKKHGGWQLRSWRGILLTTFLGMILLSILVGLPLYCRAQRRKLATCEVQFIGKLAGAMRYSAQELMEATQGYSEENLLGHGGHSVVYKGVLTDGMIVAVKKMKDVYNGSPEALLQEMQILGKLRHRNLVRVLGCVLNLDVKALVLEYMPNGSLEHHLSIHQKLHVNIAEMDSCEVLSYWEMMTRVAISIGQALAYLHHEYDVPIIHGDVKPSNILLDSDMEPHLADFGLAKMIHQGAEAISLTSGFKGSIGYMAPEYALAARITTKVDVYAYGVVLLTMLTGRSPTDQAIPDGLNLHEWVKSELSSKGYGIANVKEVLDASLLQIISPCNHIESSTYNHFFVLRLLRMGLACTEDHPNNRPTIQEVLGFLTY